MTFVEVAKIQEIRPGEVKHYEVNGKEVLLANIDGHIFATSDRCSHANAPLSMGKVEGQVIYCPLHFARFDMTTGEKLSEPVELSFQGMDMMPPDFVESMVRIGQIVGKIKTYDLTVYPVKVKDDRIFVNVY